MKFLTLNVERFRFFGEISTYISVHQPDIIHLQEASTGLWKSPVKHQDFLKALASKYNYYLVYHAFAEIHGEECISQGIATLSKYPIIDHHKNFFHRQKMEKYSSEHIWFSGVDRRKIYPHAFDTPHGFLSCLIDTPMGILRTINTHFHVSFLCQDTQQLIQEAREISTYLGNTHNHPTFLSGDFNIRYPSATLDTLDTYLNCHTKHLTNTLEEAIHPLWKNEPDTKGLAIDHIWSDTSLSIDKIHLTEEILSDHKGITCTVDFS